jgi:hypothetical protein
MVTRNLQHVEPEGKTNASDYMEFQAWFEVVK